MLQSAGLLLLFGMFRILPVPWASALGGLIGRSIGPRLKTTERARRNLRLIFPEKSADEIASLVTEMWDNLGRVVGEYPHLPDYTYGRSRKRIELVGADKLERAKQLDQPILFFSGHIANWEISPLVAVQNGVGAKLIYRAPNQPTARRLLERVRTRAGCSMLPKGKRGARELLRHVKQNGRVGILVDHKLNAGISVPFLGHAAMTSTAVPELCLKHNAVAVPVRVERLNGCRFRVTVSDPLKLARTGNHPRDVHAAAEQLNDVVSDWIRQRPGQWLWLHRRWPESKPATAVAPQSVPGRAASETS